MVKKLPIGIQDFSVLRSQNYLYVDKTEQIFRLLNGSRAVFLARPRRFGKSLTLSTIRAIFEGEKDLFEGLWIEKNWDWTQKNPIITLNFNAFSYQNLGLSQALCLEIESLARQFGVAIVGKTASQLFQSLIESVSEKYGKVVILIDEYDKPVVDFLDTQNLHIAQENRNILRNFYAPIKNLDRHIAFFMMTGVSKFSQTSIFSHLNHLEDITLSRHFNDIVGYTQSEFLTYFDHFIKESLVYFEDWTKENLVEQIKKWYNGYSWNGVQTLYNPYSVLLFLSQSMFKNHWFSTGTPTFLIELLKKNQIFNLENLQLSQQLAESFDLEKIDPRTILFQTGYLTVKHCDPRTGVYELGYPNREVAESMQSHLIGALLDKLPSDSIPPVEFLKNAFLNNKIDQVVSIINALLKSVPSHLLRTKREDFYHALVHLHFRQLGLMIQSEVNTADGRIDAIVQTPTHIHILEFKINASAALAIAQIYEKSYAKAFELESKTIQLIGINFDTKKRQINDFLVEILKKD